jgi:hypothetical protein
MAILKHRRNSETEDHDSDDRLRTIPLWLGAIVILGAALTAAGAVIALVRPIMLVSPQAEINDAVRIYAGYLVARNLAIAIMLLGLLLIGARRALGNLMVLVGFIQLFDACMDVAERRWTIAPGVLVFGLIFLFAAVRLCDDLPFWKLEAWRR